MSGGAGTSRKKNLSYVGIVFIIFAFIPHKWGRLILFLPLNIHPIHHRFHVLTPHSLVSSLKRPASSSIFPPPRSSLPFSIAPSSQSLSLSLSLIISAIPASHKKHSFIPKFIHPSHIFLFISSLSINTLWSSPFYTSNEWKQNKLCRIPCFLYPRFRQSINLTLPFFCARISSQFFLTVFRISMTFIYLHNYFYFFLTFLFLYANRSFSPRLRFHPIHLSFFLEITSCT